MSSLVFKFRDDLRLSPGFGWEQFIKFPRNYFAYARQFQQPRQQPDRPTTSPSPTDPKASAGQESTPLERTLTKQIDQFREVLNLLGGNPPTFLYDDEPSCARLSNLAQRWEAYQPVRRANPLPRPARLPNLFNYFQVEFREGELSEERLHVFLNRLEPLIDRKPLEGCLGWLMKRVKGSANQPPNPAKAGQAVPGEHLLQFAYLTDDPVPLSFATPLAAQTASAAQFYFTDMRIPLSTAAQTATPPTTPAGITIVEADSWYLQHGQFAGLAPTLLYPPASVFDVFSLPLSSGKRDHGTKILGIVAALNTDSDNGPTVDLCRGVVQKPVVRLASCLSTGTRLVGGQIDRIRYNETAAMLAAVDATPPGDTILIELGTAGARFPLDIQPAIYELLGIADQLDITVVEAAGNDHAVLNTVAPGVTDPLMPRDIRVAALQDTQNRSRSHWNAYGQNRTRIKNLAKKYGLTLGAKYGSIDAFLNHYQETPSPALLVGAAFRSQTGTFSLKPESSRGDRVRVFAQGNGILTTTSASQAAPAVGLFANDMSDTSGAAAIIAGIVLLAQQRARANGMPIITPDVMASWLTSSPGIASIPSGLATGVVPACDALLAHV